MLRAYKYRLYPTNSQKEKLAQHFGCARWVYNWGLAQKIEAWTARKESISRFDLQKQLPALKESSDTAWLSDVNSQSLQCALQNLDAAYRGFFEKRTDFPKFKSRNFRQSYQCPQGVSVGNGCIKIPKITAIKFVGDRRFVGEIKTCTISKTTTDKYYISVLVDDGENLPETQPFNESTTVGVDVGLTHFVTLSTGEKIANPRFLKRNLRKLKRAQRSLSRRRKLSNNRIKQKRKVALIYEKLTNQRNDFQHKLSTRLIRENQSVAVETLSVEGMLKNRRLSQAISDAAWSGFIQKLEYKAKWYGKTVIKIGRFEPSTKMCSCGTINHSLTLQNRVWTCSSCNTTHDRDILAANNIKRFALHPQSLIRSDRPEFTRGESSNRNLLNRESQ